MRLNRLGSVAKITEVGAIKFASKKEARRWQELKLLERAGEIDDLMRQVPIPLRGEHDWIKTPTGKIMHYVADFTYAEIDKKGRIERLVIEDAKGHKTEVYLIKKAIMAAMGLTIREV
jgi:hypothetical protein